MKMLVAVFFVTAPFLGFSQNIISDSELDKVTAEEGVSIGFENFSLGGSTAAGTITLLGDGNGYPTAGYSTRGYAGAANVNISGNITQMSGNLVIDVGTSGTSTRFNLMLPTITLGTASVTSVMRLSSSIDLSSGKKLGELMVRDFSTQVTSDCLQIYAHQ